MSIKEDLKELFSFNRSQRNGVIVLLSLIFLVFTVNLLFVRFYHEKKYDYSEFQKEIDSFLAQRKPSNETQSENRLNKAILERYDTLKLFNFDPNQMTAEIGLNLGLSEKQVNTILNAIKKGYRFYDKDDFRKIYGIRQKQYEILSPYIKIKTASLQHFQRYTEEKYREDFPSEDSLFTFDPNTATETQWKQLGFSEKQISTIQNFTSKGGKFKTPDDLKKIYGIKSTQYEKIKDYIAISSTNTSGQNTIVKIIDLNNDDVEKLKTYGGFWKYNAAKIVKYRTALGGFVNKSQLYELYGIKKEYVDKISDSVYIDRSKIEKIRINFADTEELSKHPYLSFENAKDIIRFRDLNGPFFEIKKLRQAKIISETTYQQIYPYITEK